MRDIERMALKRVGWLANDIFRRVVSHTRHNSFQLKSTVADMPNEDEPPKHQKFIHDLRSVRGSCAVYGVGLTQTGSLGISSLIKNRTSPEIFFRPLRITFLNTKKIKRVSAGLGFSLFSSTTELYGSGLNNFYQLGGAIRNRELRLRNENPEWFVYPRKIKLSESDACKIIDLASGRLHSLVATTQGLYAFGDNAHGQCGHDPERSPVVTHNREGHLCSVELPEQSPIRKVHCSLDTSFVLMENGNLYSFGLGTDGQLGTGDEKEVEWRPTLLGGDLKNEKISRISGSVDTLIAVSTKVFVWGQNEYGQLPNEDEPQVRYPRFLPFSNLGRATCAGATGSSCIVCNEQGEVFTWGSIILGFGPRVHKLDCPMQLDVPLFAPSIGDQGKVEWVYAGDSVMAAVTKSGQLFTWGANRHGNLALGHAEPQHFPYQVFLPERLKNASFGPDHSLFVTHQ